jgi:5'-3' exoribonuclease 1
MGVKHFYIYIRNNFSNCINKNVSSFKTKNIHNLCIDMNGIIHNCAQEIYEYGNFKKQRLISRKNLLTLKNQLRLFNRICENVDEIRQATLPSKRIILCIDGVAGVGKMAQQRQRRFKSDLEFDKTKFNQNCISSGTEFMNYLSKYIDWYIRLKQNTDDEWKNLEVVFSNEKVPGEGEHKIINYIRKFGKESESFCIHGLDADLIMLGMSLNKNDIYILRDNIRYGKYESNLVDISLLKKEINERLNWNNDEDKKVSYSKDKGITDFVFMCFLVGNDFLPNIPSLAILDGGIDSMIDVYRNVCKEYGHLTKTKRVIGNMLNLDSLEVFLGSLSQYEKGLLEEKYKNLDKFIDDPLLKKYFEGNEFDFEGYKKEFYQKKLGIEEEDTLTKKEVCNNYIQGLDWVINYYKLGNPSWTWYYKRFYAPFLSDITNCIKDYKYDWKANQGKPLTTTQQLMCVLPKNSHYLIPSPFRNNLYNQFTEYYPNKFDVDTSGKRREWEGIVLVGMVDVEKIKEYHKQNKKDIDRKGLMLERLDEEYVYKYNEFKNDSVFKSYYGDIQSNKVVRQIL